MSGRSWEDLPQIQEESRDPPRRSGGVVRPSRRFRWPFRKSTGDGRPSQRSGEPPTFLGRVGRTSHLSRRGGEDLPQVREG